MLEMMTKLSEAIKIPVFPFSLLAVTHKSATDANVKLNKRNPANNKVPGDNFPFIPVNGYRTR